MATDFFDRQDYARRQTTRLLVMFALAVAVIVLAVYFVVVLLAGDGSQPRLAEAPYGSEPSSLWQPLLLAWVALGTLAVISLGSLYKIAELSSGGQTVALMLGGRAINPQTQDLAERRLLNVVEEMALAAGLPVPPVFVLEQEPGINAFAAGHQPGDAVVAVSRGCLAYLNREELQGVIGHEFSHVLNGDMRLNLRLIGIVHGILILAIIGYYLMRGAAWAPRDKKGKDATAAIVILGLALVVLGYLGVLLGKIIKSAVSRQREYLADASSVQFTRNPAGIVGALKKIGGLEEGSRIRDPHAEEISHMFFGDAFAGALVNLFATHPPLVDRIRPWEPNFEGQFPPVEPVVESAEEEPARRQSHFPPLPLAGGVLPVPAAVMPLDAGSVVGRVGQLGTAELAHAGTVLAGLPPLLQNAAREPYAARALMYALLLSRDDQQTRSGQVELLRAQVEPPLLQEVLSLADALGPLSEQARLPLVAMAVPALKHLSPGQYAAFRRIIEALVAPGGHVELFAYCLRTVLLGYLDVHFGLKKPNAVRYRALAPVVPSAVTVLSTLAYVGQDEPEAIQRAFQAGARGLNVAILPQEQCTLQAFDAALTQLAQASPAIKKQMMSACAACIAADGKLTLQESELLRAVAAALACPLPPGIPEEAAGP